MNPILAAFIGLMKMTPLEPVATALEKDLADGKIDIVEADELVVVATAKAGAMFPIQAPEIMLAHDCAAAFGTYWKAKHPPVVAAPGK